MKMNYNSVSSLLESVRILPFVQVISGELDFTFYLLFLNE